MALDDFGYTESEFDGEGLDFAPDGEKECPECEKVGNKSAYWYYRCTTASCPVVTYTYPERESGL